MNTKTILAAVSATVTVGSLASALYYKHKLKEAEDLMTEIAEEIKDVPSNLMKVAEYLMDEEIDA